MSGVSVINVGQLCFVAYIVVTFFLGNNVISYLGLPTAQNGALFSIHYIALPFLLMSVLTRKSVFYKWKPYEMFSLLSFFVVFIVSKFFSNKSADFSLVVNSLLEPFLLVWFLRTNPHLNRNLIVKIIVLFLLVECGIAIYEAFFKKLVFVPKGDVFEFNGLDSFNQAIYYVRAYSIHGHPLANTCIVVMVLSLILLSDLSVFIRYSLAFLGLLAIIAFNTRSALVIISIPIIFSILRDLKGKSKFSTIALLTAATFIVMFGLEFLIANELGGKFSVAIGSKDGSSMARLVLLKIVSNIDIKDLLIGLNADYVNDIRRQYALVAIENSIVGAFFCWGIPYALVYFYAIFRTFWSLNVDRKATICFLIVFFMLLNVNNILQTSTPIVSIGVILLYFMQTNENERGTYGAIRK